MTDSPDESPNFLDTRARRGAGVRRLNRIPLLIAGFLLLMIGGAVFYTYQMRIAELRRQAAESQSRPEPANISELFTGAPSSGLIEEDRPKGSPEPEPAPALPRESAPTARPTERTTPVLARPERQKDDEWSEYRRQRAELAARREQRLKLAIAASTEVPGVQRPIAQPAPAGPDLQASTPNAFDLYRSELSRQGQLIAAENGKEEDINRAAEKRAFLNDRALQSQAENYLSSGREAPLSPYEVKAGTVISAIMISGIMSDLPGQIIGQVSANVYDTATGRHILIPQGSKLVGTFDNAVTTGQERVLVAWTRIIYPDASSVDLGKMPGTDASGLAGFHDKVNNHYLKMFGSALLMSIFSAGVQISQGGDDSDGLSAQQAIAAGLGQQLGQLGQEIARRNSRIQPTLEVRPGYRFTVMVTKDMALSPWKKR